MMSTIVYTVAALVVVVGIAGLFNDLVVSRSVNNDKS